MKGSITHRIINAINILQMDPQNGEHLDTKKCVRKTNKEFLLESAMHLYLLNFQFRQERHEMGKNVDCVE